MSKGTSIMPNTTSDILLTILSNSLFEGCLCNYSYIITVDVYWPLRTHVHPIWFMSCMCNRSQHLHTHTHTHTQEKERNTLRRRPVLSNIFALHLHKLLHMRYLIITEQVSSRDGQRLSAELRASRPPPATLRQLWRYGSGAREFICHLR